MGEFERSVVSICLVGVETEVGETGIGELERSVMSICLVGVETAAEETKGSTGMGEIERSEVVTDSVMTETELVTMDLEGGVVEVSEMFSGEEYDESACELGRDMLLDAGLGELDLLLLLERDSLLAGEVLFVGGEVRLLAYC